MRVNYHTGDFYNKAKISSPMMTTHTHALTVDVRQLEINISKVEIHTLVASKTLWLKQQRDSSQAPPK